jgi:hypothetical protein
MARRKAVSCLKRCESRGNLLCHIDQDVRFEKRGFHPQHWSWGSLSYGLQVYLNGPKKCHHAFETGWIIILVVPLLHRSGCWIWEDRFPSTAWELGLVLPWVACTACTFTYSEPVLLILVASRHMCARSMLFFVVSCVFVVSYTLFVKFTTLAS